MIGYSTAVSLYVYSVKNRLELNGDIVIMVCVGVFVHEKRIDALVISGYSKDTWMSGRKEGRQCKDAQHARVRDINCVTSFENNREQDMERPPATWLYRLPPPSPFLSLSFQPSE